MIEPATPVTNFDGNALHRNDVATAPAPVTPQVDLSPAEQGLMQLMSLSTVRASYPDHIGLDAARALHRRRALAQALEHGFALLDALNLPAIALDVIDAAIAALDALEAPDEDLEPWLAGYQATAFFLLDAENDDEYPEDDDPAEGTSLERFGRGFVRCGADDEEDSDPAERDDEHGCESESHPWRRDPALVAFAAQVAHV